VPRSRMRTPSQHARHGRRGQSRAARSDDGRV
jgi:hypothetical protein